MKHSFPAILMNELYHDSHSLTACLVAKVCYSIYLFFLMKLGYLDVYKRQADQLYSGNLRYSAERIPTFLSLLIPAFSLLIPPLLLPVQLHRS